MADKSVEDHLDSWGLSKYKEKFKGKMAPLTAAEKQKRYKDKLKKDPAKYEEYKRKKRENYHAKKRLVKDLTPKEKYNARIIWKLKKRNQRENKKRLHRVLDITPPSSPRSDQNIVLEANIARNLPIINQIVAQPGSTKNIIERGRKKIRRDRTKLYRENTDLKEQIIKLERKCHKYKKRYERSKSKIKPKVAPKLDTKEKYEKLSNAIRERYKNIKKKRDKGLLKSVFNNMDRSSKEQIIGETLGLKGKLRVKENIRKRVTDLKQNIHDFFIRDDISRATAGKKETVTKANEKVQKRFLLDDMKNLFKTFKRERPDTKCSYYYFTKNRPFFVVKPSIDARETCLCKLHINPIYKAQCLKRKHILNTSDLNQHILSIACDVNSQSCMYGICQLCSSKEIKYDLSKGPFIPHDEQVVWYEWVRQEERFEKDGKKMKAIKTVKQVKEGQTKQLMEEFNKELKMLKKHVYNMKTQYKNFRQAVDGLNSNEVVVVADFSENYSCKHHEEIQSHHFGGSRQQVSLHTVVTYLLDEDSNQKVESYCTISASIIHQPAAIWAHLHPILDNISNNHPNIDTIHFFTDGPFSQYRQKQNFYLSCTKFFDYGFAAMTWSFFEAGHGKGPADGIGGFLKRRADTMVATGVDIPTANQFYQVLNHQSKIKLFEVLSENIETISGELPPKIKPLPGTKDVHQIFTTARGELKYRNLSCFCQRGICDCLQPKIYRPVVMTPVRKNKGKQKPTKAPKILSIDMESSDEDIPLSELRTDFLNFYVPRYKSVYDMVYSPNNSDEEPEASTSRSHVDKENRPVCSGDYLLVNVNATKGKTFKYACLVDHLDDDGEIKVTFLRRVKNDLVFRLDLNDVAYIEFTDIVKILETPVIKIKGGLTYYEFSKPVDVYEK